MLPHGLREASSQRKTVATQTWARWDDGGVSTNVADTVHSAEPTSKTTRAQAAAEGAPAASASTHDALKTLIVPTLSDEDEPADMYVEVQTMTRVQREGGLHART